MRRKTLKIYFWAIVCGMIYSCLLYFTPIRLKCFVLETLGVQCPGCGTTRMFISMAKFNFKAAFEYNPLIFILFVIWNIIGIFLIVDKVKFIKNPVFLYSAMWVSVAFMVVWGVIRNF